MRRKANMPGILCTVSLGSIKQNDPFLHSLHVSRICIFLPTQFSKKLGLILYSARKQYFWMIVHIFSWMTAYFKSYVFMEKFVVSLLRALKLLQTFGKITHNFQKFIWDCIKWRENASDLLLEIYHRSTNYFIGC